MTVHYLLDTNILSEPTRPRPNERITERLSAHRMGVATATPVLHELLYGMQCLPLSPRRQQIERYVIGVVRAQMTIFDYDVAAAEWHARERARLISIGRTPTFIDGQIAAIAAINGLILVTTNTADFQYFDGLQLEDWRR